MSRPRPVIALLASSTVEPWASRQWEGVVDAASDLDVGLVSYIGGVLRSARFDERANVMYDLAARGRPDGFIVWATALGWLLERPEMADFLARFSGTPVVSLEMAFPGIPAVLMDDYGGMRAAIDHLIEDHGRRRLAFIRGPATHEGCEARFRAYRDGLEAHGLPWDPRLASPPSPDIDGAAAMGLILDETAGEVDAVAGADDLLALPALRLLVERGYKVPDEVSVIGFDNMPEDLTTKPPLASVDPPFAAMGRRAMETILGMIEGRSVPESETFPVGFARRRSCGCRESDEEILGRFSSSRVEAPRRAAIAVAAGASDDEATWAAIAEALREVRPPMDMAAFRGLWELFSAEARGRGEAGSFIASLEEGIAQTDESGDDPSVWLDPIVLMQHESSAWTASLDYESRIRAGELWSRALGLAAAAIRRRIARRHVAFAARHSVLRSLSERLNSLYDIPGQMAILSRFLSRLRIPACYVSVFSCPEEPTGEARLILAYGEGGGLDLPEEGLAFPAPELAPAELAPPVPGTSRLALALFLGRTRLGFVVFDIEGKEDALICELLRWQISVALKGTADIRAEKATAAEKAMLLRELQHRVKNSLGLIAGIAGIESREAEQPETRLALEKLRTRIAAVGDLYEALFDSGNIQEVDLSEYLVRVIESALESVGEESGRISLGLDLEPCPMDLKRAVSLGLVVNELVTDSIKHAFPDGCKGAIRVGLARKDGEIVLDVRDDGIGFPPGMETGEPEGFGLRMVSLLVEQVRGRVEYDPTGPGARTVIRMDGRPPSPSERSL